jgi:hypothetical protein
MKKHLYRMSYLLLFLVMFIARTSTAQVWEPLNFKPVKAPVVSYATSNYYIVGYADGLDSDGKNFTFMRWNGKYWQRLPALALDSHAILTSLTLYKGNLYVAGQFTSPHSVKIQNIAKLNSTAWVHAGAGTEFNAGTTIVRSMEADDNGLYVGGTFSKINGTAVTNVAKFDGTNWSKLGTVTVNGPIQDLYLDGTNLYVAGGFSKLGNKNSKAIAHLSGATWNALGSNLFTSGILISSYGGNLFGVVKNGSNQLEFFENVAGTWTSKQGNLFGVDAVRDVIEFEGKLYACGKFFFSASDSSEVAMWDGSTWAKATGKIHSANGFDIFQSQLHAHGAIAKEQEKDAPVYTAKMVKTRLRITGRVYNDINEDCIFNGADVFLGKQVIKITPGDIYVHTDERGRYSVLLDKGITYTVELQMPRNWRSSSCGNSSVNVTLNESRSDVHFPIVRKGQVNDLGVAISSGNGWWANRGDREHYSIIYKNMGSENETGQLELNFDTGLINFEAKPIPTTQGPGQAIWDFSDLKVGETREIIFWMKVDELGFNEGDELEFELKGTIGNDVYPEDNLDSLVQGVEDFNVIEMYKRMYPEPAEGDTISFVPQNRPFLDYIIRFENHYPDTLRTVHVIDTIDLNISLSFIQEISASHPYTTKLFQDPKNPEVGIIMWTFENINLPMFDLKYNEQTPNFGYISFKLKMKDNPIGTLVSNQATVIFDYTEENYTNTVWAEVTDPVVSTDKVYLSDKRLTLYPNPTSDLLKVAVEGNRIESIKVLTVQGEQVLDLQYEDYSEVSVDMSQLASGMYFVLVTGKDGTFVGKVQKD